MFNNDYSVERKVLSNANARKRKSKKAKKSPTRRRIGLETFIRQFSMTAWNRRLRFRPLIAEELDRVLERFFLISSGATAFEGHELVISDVFESAEPVDESHGVFARECATRLFDAAGEVHVLQKRTGGNERAHLARFFRVHVIEVAHDADTAVDSRSAENVARNRSAVRYLTKEVRFHSAKRLENNVRIAIARKLRKVRHEFHEKLANLLVGETSSEQRSPP